MLQLRSVHNPEYAMRMPAKVFGFRMFCGSSRPCYYEVMPVIYPLLKYMCKPKISAVDARPQWARGKARKWDTGAGLPTHASNRRKPGRG